MDLQNKTNGGGAPSGPIPIVSNPSNTKSIKE